MGDRIEELFKQKLVSESDFTAGRTAVEVAEANQDNALAQIRRTARPGAVVLLRSVEHADPVSAVGAHAWMHKRACSTDAAQADRTRQYRQVNFYEVDA